MSATSCMDRKSAGDIPDFLVSCGRYEFCAVEVGKKEEVSTKELNDGAIKLASTIKSMFLNLAKHSPKIQSDLRVEGMLISGNIPSKECIFCDRVFEDLVLQNEHGKTIGFSVDR